MISLHKELNLWIKREGYVSYQQVVDYCNAEHYKIESASRKLRRSQSPNIGSILKNGAIVGWCWDGIKTVDLPPIKEPGRQISFLQKSY